VPRSYFDQTKGAELLRKLARQDTYDATLVEEYILLSSSYAVLQYAQLCLGAELSRHCLTLDINVGGNHRMNIDRSTMVNLELMINAKTGRNAHSLVGTIDCTKTSVGGRLLRTNLMAPPTRLDTIHARLDLVDSLLEDEEFFYVVMEHLEDLPDVDKMLAYVALAPRKKRQTVTARIASRGISALVCIKSILSLIPSFAHVLEQTRHQLLRAILIATKQPALARVLDAVTNIFTESTTYNKNSHAMRHQECFALKPNTDGMMDVLRKAFLANVDDIYRLADEYAEAYDITVSVKETTARGYYLSVSADLGLDLPQIFIQPVKNGRFIHCTTEEVYSLNCRAQENVQDLLLMTHARIQEVLEVARDHYDCLASLSDAIALLDMCHCFADNVASSRMPWCRPVLSDREKHPNNQEDASSSAGGNDFVPNDTYSSALQNFTVITGINGSGKSTYLKQIALIVILAHCGCYVPAEEALVPIRDQICTRIGTTDDQEHNISTFLLEMKETAFICNSTTEKSLFLLDELGRATSNEDGVAVAWAVSEYLLTKRAMTFFVTHYPQISKLAEVYPNVQNQHLGSHISPVYNEDGSNINYTHKILPGPCKAAGDYGLEMAATCGWPEDNLENARKIRLEVQQK
ncbi:DNA mismatch repair mutS protein, partial [Thalassiosira pseudonana CCMP1335]